MLFNRDNFESWQLTSTLQHFSHVCWFSMFSCSPFFYSQNRLFETPPKVSEGSRLQIHEEFLGVASTVAFLTYFTLNVLFTGQQVPTGNFTGAMLIGGMAGRMMGCLLGHWWPEIAFAPQGCLAEERLSSQECCLTKFFVLVQEFLYFRICNPRCFAITMKVSCGQDHEQQAFLLFSFLSLYGLSRLHRELVDWSECKTRNLFHDWCCCNAV